MAQLYLFFWKNQNEKNQPNESFPIQEVSEEDMKRIYSVTSQN